MQHKHESPISSNPRIKLVLDAIREFVLSLSNKQILSLGMPNVVCRSDAVLIAGLDGHCRIAVRDTGDMRRHFGEFIFIDGILWDWDRAEEDSIGQICDLNYDHGLIFDQLAEEMKVEAKILIDRWAVSYIVKKIVLELEDVAETTVDSALYDCVAALDASDVISAARARVQRMPAMSALNSSGKVPAPINQPKGV